MSNGCNEEGDAQFLSPAKASEFPCAYTMNESERIQKLGMTTSELVKWAYPSIFNGHGFDRLYHLDVANAMYVVCLDKNYRPMANPVPVHLGSRGGILIHPRDILKVPLRWCCDKIVVIMTATTGEDKTSKTAYIFGGESGTKYEAEVIARIRLAAETVGIKLLDWIHIRNDGAWYDWNRSGNMTGVSRPRVSADDDTSANLWDDPGTTDLSNEKTGRHALERKWGFGISESTSSAGMSAEDLTYERLVKSGQKSKAMTLLRKHAGKMLPDTKIVDVDGLPKIVYHQTTVEHIRVFVPSAHGHLGSGVYFHPTLPSNNYYGDVIYACFVNITHPSLTNELGNPPDIVRDSSEYMSRLSDGTNAVLKLGFDGFVNSVIDRGELVAFRPEQVKLADITYDDSGKLIPLSKRFDTTNPDVRY